MSQTDSIPADFRKWYAEFWQMRGRGPTQAETWQHAQIALAARVELLEAALEIANRYAEGDYVDNNDWARYNELRAAIVKAKGGAA